MATINVLIVGGGGGGGKGAVINRAAGGGGAGGFITGSAAFTAGQLTVIVGAGGAAGTDPSFSGTNGGNSSVTGFTTAVGGGAGSGGNAAGGGSAGGSGGGAGDNNGSVASGGSGTGGQGSAGGNNGTSGGSGGSGGGGGGSAGVGSIGVTASSVRPAGGAGTSNSLSGAPVTYAAGGSGGEYFSGTDGTAGGANTGNGGGGGCGNKGGAGVSGLGAAGGSGIVIISYTTGALVGVTGGTVTTSGGNTIHTFTTNGTFGFPPTPVIGLNFDFPLPRRYQQYSGYRPRTDFQLGVNLALKFPYVPPTPSATIVVSIGGITKTTSVDMSSVHIQDNLNEQPNTCSLRVHGFTPTVGMDVKIGLGAIDPVVLIFAGTIVDVNQVYDDIPRTTGNIAWEVSCTDYVYLLNRRRPTGQYVNQPADEVIRNLFSLFSSGFDTSDVPTGLPIVTISFDGSSSFAQCLTNICNAVGYHWKMGYAKDVQVFVSASGTDPTPITGSTTTTQANPAFHYTINLDQIRTRVTGRGVSSPQQADTAAAETIVPVQDSTAFSASGGSAYQGPNPITYTGITSSAGGSFVGTGASPTSPPVAAAAAGSGLGAGVYTYAYTDVTAAGESIPSPLATVTTFTLPTPGTAPVSDTSNTFDGTSTYAVGDTVSYYTSNGGATISTDLTNESSLSPAGTFVAVASTGFPGYAAAHPITWTPSTDPNVKWTRIYRQVNGGNILLVNTYAPPSNGPVVLNYYGVNVLYPGANPDHKQVNVSSIAVGVSPTTSRKLYRTVVGGSQLKLVTTIANNVATTYTDSTADGSLGANAPTSDTSGLVQGTGSVSVGATSIPLSSLATFQSGGGWVAIGGIFIRYGTISSTALTGIPTSGAGSITAPLNYGSTANPVPAITGVVGSMATVKGAPVGILVTQDDLVAQAAIAILEGGDGIHEFQFTDTSIVTITQLTQVVLAQLSLFKSPIITITESARDIHTKAGQTLVVTLPAPMSITASLLIQTVDITNIGTEQGQFPLYTAKASSVKFTLQDFLRQLGALINVSASQ